MSDLYTNAMLCVRCGLLLTSPPPCTPKNLAQRDEHLSMAQRSALYGEASSASIAAEETTQ